MRTPRQIRLHGDLPAEAHALLHAHHGGEPLTLEVRDQKGRKVLHCPAAVVLVDTERASLELRVDAVLIVNIDGSYEETEAKSTIRELMQRVGEEDRRLSGRRGIRAETEARDRRVRAAYEDGATVAEIALREDRSEATIQTSLRRTAQ